MGAMLQSPRTTAKRAVREMMRDRESNREALTMALQVVMMDALRASFKEIVKEAIREVREESTGSTDRGPGRGALFLGVGIAVGYLAATGRSSMMGRDRSDQKAIEIDRGDEETIPSED